MTSKNREVTLRYEEVNLALNGIVSIQNRVKTTNRSWEETLNLPNNRVITLRCSTTEDQVVPHGLDNDFQAGLQNLFLAQGCPANNRVRFTIHALIQASGLDTSGRYYDKALAALKRLKAANFSFEGGWHDGTDWVTVQFSLIERLTIKQTHRTSAVAGDLVEVQLPSEMAESLRRGYVKSLNTTLLRKLQQPAGRTLYRLLDGIRYATPGEPLSVFETDLESWGRRCRLFDRRADRIRDILNPAHEALLKARYLTDVQYFGRGTTQTLRYEFASEIEVNSPQLIQRLEAAGIALKVGRQLIGAIGPLEVASRLTEALAIQESSSKGLGAGFLVQFIREPENYRSRTPPAIKAAPVMTGQPRLLLAEAELEINHRASLLRFLKMRLKRAPSAAAVQAIEALSDAQAQALVASTTARPAHEALSLAESLLKCVL
ncbi:replication initiator protein A [Deinococcus oregonensis]|uniref:Replication initiator protein A n=1 Tax=Deinococcus oregonensis TaxID=1805970 RepID=A0ABV6B1W8_9DEIO